MPADVVVLDMETYFDSTYCMGRSARALSTIEYVMDPRFEVLGMGRLTRPAGLAHSPAQASFWHDAAGDLKWLQSKYGWNLDRCTVVAQNAAYDGLILTKRFGIMPLHVVDILGLARHLDPGQSNSLASLCKRWGLPDKGDTMQFSGYGWDERLGPPCVDRNVFTKNKKPKVKVPRVYLTGSFGNGGTYREIVRKGMDEPMRKALAAYCCNDVEREWDLFQILLPLLSNPTTELRLMRHTLGLFWDPIIEVDFAEGTRLAEAMEAKTVEAAASVGHTPEELRKDTFVDLLVEAGARVPMKPGTNGPIPALAKDDDGLALLKEHPNERVRDLVLARAAVKSWPLHSARVRRIMAQARANGGLLPVPLKYCGAHTGRWSGGERINLQNLSSRSVEELINQIRWLLVPPAGHVLAIADASQIEARILAYLAGQWDLVEAFENNAPIYENFAASILGIPVTKKMKERALGKVGVLGCGYGMGPDRCEEYARNTYHVENMTFELAKRIVDHYRRTNPAICRFWGQVERAFKLTTKYGETRHLDRGLRFFREGEDTTTIRLPNNRCLRYAGARVKGSGRDEQIAYPDTQKPGAWTWTWGGGLVENIVQAVARDVLAEAMLLVEDWGQDIGLRIGHHVHDEMIGVVREEHGDRALELEIAALSVRPNWLPGCPLAAEGTVARRYGKG
ncbi:MAG: DNA polymerase [Planctomycetia bacterium]|nr:DNA polymerase [Planctomycetia bacterium]